MRAAPFSLSAGMKKLVVRCLLGLVGVLTVLAMAGWWLAGRTPRWYIEAAAATSPGAGEALEKGLLTAMSAEGGSGSPRVFLATTAQINAWLSERLPLWVENQGGSWPPGAGMVAATCERGSLRIGVLLGASAGGRGPEGGRVISLGLAPGVMEDGGITWVAQSVAIGQLELPSWLAGGLVRARVSGQKAGTQAERVIDALMGGGLAVPPARLDDGRMVRATEAEVGETGVRVKFVTEPTPRSEL